MPRKVTARTVRDSQPLRDVNDQRRRRAQRAGVGADVDQVRGREQQHQK
jgi:hypothetical protein